MIKLLRTLAAAVVGLAISVISFATQAELGLAWMGCLGSRY